MSLKGHRVYLDANTAIYAMEGVSTYSNLETALPIPLDSLKLAAVTSRLTLLEALVFPLRTHDQAAQKTFRTFLTPSSHKLIEPVNDAVLEKATELRAHFPRLRTPDAIHIATGILARCDAFVPGDQDWSRVGINTVEPQDLA